MLLLKMNLYKNRHLNLILRLAYLTKNFRGNGFMILLFSLPWNTGC